MKNTAIESRYLCKCAYILLAQIDVQPRELPLPDVTRGFTDLPFINESFGPRAFRDKEGRPVVIKSFLCVDHKVQKPFTSERDAFFWGCRFLFSIKIRTAEAAVWGGGLVAVYGRA